MPYVSSLNQKGVRTCGGKHMSIPTGRLIQLLDALPQNSLRLNTVKLYLRAGHGLRNIRTGQFEDYAQFIFEWLEKNLEHGKNSKTSII